MMTVANNTNYKYNPYGISLPQEIEKNTRLIDIQRHRDIINLANNQEEEEPEPRDISSYTEDLTDARYRVAFRDKLIRQNIDRIKRDYLKPGTSTDSFLKSVKLLEHKEAVFRLIESDDRRGFHHLYLEANNVQDKEYQYFTTSMSLYYIIWERWKRYHERKRNIQ